MKIAVSSDGKNHFTDALLEELNKRGHSLMLFGPINEHDTEKDWPLVSAHAAEAVANGEADEAIVCCWSGTGACIAANKVPGIRAALVQDAETAKLARIYNHANTLAFSMRATPVAVMKEILDNWFATSITEGASQTDWNNEQIKRIEDLEKKYASQA
jgi:ribose 5-phosphate isomerase B